MKPFVVDKSQLHFKLARLGGVKIKEDRVQIYDSVTGKSTPGKTYELNVKDFCSYWRRVALGGLFAMLILMAVALYLTPILIFLLCLAMPHFAPLMGFQWIPMLRGSAIFMIGGGLLIVSVAVISIILIVSKGVDLLERRKKQLEKLRVEGKLPVKPEKIKKAKKVKPAKEPRESIIVKAYRTHKEKYCVPVKLDVDGSFDS